MFSLTWILASSLFENFYATKHTEIILKYCVNLKYATIITKKLYLKFDVWLKDIVNQI